MRVLRWLAEYGLESIGAALLVEMCLVVFAQVVFRYVLFIAITWAEELSTYSFVWLVMIGASVAVKRRSHFGIRFLVDRLPSRAQAGASIVALVGMSYLLVLLIFQGWLHVQLNHTQMSPALGIPMSLPYLAVPVGCGLMLVLLWVDAVRDLKAGFTQSEMAGVS